MEHLASKFLISSARAIFPTTYSVNKCANSMLGTKFKAFRLLVHFKRSSNQDFQEYAKPSRLLQATEVKACNDASNGKIFDSFLSGQSVSLFKVKIQTSKLYGSALNDMNSGILLCLIDEDGHSILQRLGSTSVGTTYMDDILHFQRGSVDEFTFLGPNLSRIAAIWISLDSGQWRIGGISLTVVSHSQPSSPENNPENKHLCGSQYNFDIEDILLGEKGDAPMMELKPQSITSFSDNESTFFDTLNAPPSLNSPIMSNEQSMKEYSYLKFSLLLYDVALILVGSTFAYISAGENACCVFLVGGLFGFFYLLSLQRLVDGISPQDFVPDEETNGRFSQVFGRLNLKGPISSLALAFAFAVCTFRYASGEGAFSLSPKDVIFGMMGFLMCKVSVVLAAYKPVLGGKE